MLKYRRYYNKLPLKELRWRQAINYGQTQEAYRLSQQPDTEHRGLKALIRLQRIALFLADTVARRFLNKRG